MALGRMHVRASHSVPPSRCLRFFSRFLAFGVSCPDRATVAPALPCIPTPAPPSHAAAPAPSDDAPAVDDEPTRRALSPASRSPSASCSAARAIASPPSDGAPAPAARCVDAVAACASHRCLVDAAG